MVSMLMMIEVQVARGWKCGEPQPNAKATARLLDTEIWVDVYFEKFRPTAGHRSMRCIQLLVELNRFALRKQKGR